MCFFHRCRSQSMPRLISCLQHMEIGYVQPQTSYIFIPISAKHDHALSPMREFRGLQARAWLLVETLLIFAAALQ